MELDWNEEHTAYAVLISTGFGSGWSTANMEYPEIAYDKRVVEWYLEHSGEQFCSTISSDFKRKKEETLEAIEFFESLGYHGLYFGGYKPNMVKWVRAEAIWRVSEYDGSEIIEYFNPTYWNKFPNNEVH